MTTSEGKIGAIDGDWAKPHQDSVDAMSFATNTQQQFIRVPDVIHDGKTWTEERYINTGKMVIKTTMYHKKVEEMNK